MKKQTNHFLIYDTACPLCQCYTQGFVRLGFLTSKGRMPYSVALKELKGRFDEIKAKNRIALVSDKNQQTLYGIDALLELLDTKIPFIKTVGQFKPIKFLLDQCYDFISYNRKIIAPSKESVTCSCEPSVSYYWRFMFVIVNLFLSTMLILKIETYKFLDSQVLLGLISISFLLVSMKYLLPTVKAIKSLNYYQVYGFFSFSILLVFILTNLIISLFLML
jgi:predicted DCC family thiol-disulfide oxidoreductase YuxK